MEQLTLVPVFLYATDGAKDTAQEFETAKPEKGIYSIIQRAAVLRT